VKKDELQRKVEEVKQDADVQRALKQATAAPAKDEDGPVARMRDKLLIGTHLFLLLGLAAVHQLVKYRFPRFFENYPVVQKLLMAFGVVVVCLMVLRLIDVYFIGRVRNVVYQ
jgi:hypothetical protein